MPWIRSKPLVLNRWSGLCRDEGLDVKGGVRNPFIAHPELVHATSFQ